MGQPKHQELRVFYSLATLYLYSPWMPTSQPANREGRADGTTEAEAEAQAIEMERALEPSRQTGSVRVLNRRGNRLTNRGKGKKTQQGSLPSPGSPFAAHLEIWDPR